jgi:hypothetical protein
MFQHMNMTGFADRARLAQDLLRPGVAGSGRRPGVPLPVPRDGNLPGNS